MRWVANKPLIERISKLEVALQTAKVSEPTNVRPTEENLRDADVRIYFRDGRKDDAESLLSALQVRFPTVSTENTDLTEVGQERDTGFSRVRYETTSNTTLADDAKWIQEESAKALGKKVTGPDPVNKSLPGDIQILLY